MVRFLPEQIVGHVIRVCRGKDIVNKSIPIPIDIPSGTLAICDKISTDGTRIDIRLLKDGTPYQGIPADFFDVGALYIARGKPLPVRIVTPDIPSVANLTRTFSDLGNDPIREGIATFLEGVAFHRTRIPHLYRRHLRLMKDKATMRSSATRVCNAVRAVNPNLLSKMTKKDYTFQDLIGTLPEFDTTDHSAGCYLIVMSDQPKKAEKHGRTYAYVGQSGDMGLRQREHSKSMRLPSDDAYHRSLYKTMREVEQVRFYKLSESPLTEDGSEDNATGLRELAEQIFILLLGSYNVLLADRLEARAGVESEDVADKHAKSYNAYYLYKLYRDLADSAFKLAGCSPPTNTGRWDKFGLRNGRNWDSPFGGQSLPDYNDRIIWVQTETHDRYIFRRAPMKLGPAGMISSMGYRDHGPARKHFRPYLTVKAEERARIGIDVGDTFYASWELMKNEVKHPQCHFRLRDIAPWSNWGHVNTLGIKLSFKSRKLDKWVTHYLQKEPIVYPVEPPVSDVPSDTSYSIGTGLYSFFTGAQYPGALDWQAEFGTANVLVLEVDHFNQVVILTSRTSPLFALPKVELQWNVVRDQMRTLGLQHVNGPFGQGRDNSWFTDPAYYEEGAHSKGKGGRPYDFSACDHCTVLQRSAFTGSTGVPEGMDDKCIRYKDSDTCSNCLKRGLLCSWTIEPVIFGRYGHYRLLPNGKRVRQILRGGDLHAKMIPAMFKQPKAADSLLVYTDHEPPLGYQAVQPTDDDQDLNAPFAPTTITGMPFRPYGIAPPAGSTMSAMPTTSLPAGHESMSLGQLAQALGHGQGTSTQTAPTSALLRRPTSPGQRLVHWQVQNQIDPDPLPAPPPGYHHMGPRPHLTPAEHQAFLNWSTPIWNLIHEGDRLDPANLRYSQIRVQMIGLMRAGETDPNHSPAVRAAVRHENDRAFEWWYSFGYMPSVFFRRN